MVPYADKYVEDWDGLLAIQCAKEQRMWQSSFLTTSGKLLTINRSKGQYNQEFLQVLFEARLGRARRVTPYGYASTDPDMSELE